MSMCGLLVLTLVHGAVVRRTGTLRRGTFEAQWNGLISRAQLPCDFCVLCEDPDEAVAMCGANFGKGRPARRAGGS